MTQLSTLEKLAILADAAKYDASCASSGTTGRDSRAGKGAPEARLMITSHPAHPLRPGEAARG